MLVVIILSLTILGLGFAMFFRGAQTIGEVTGQVDERNQQLINQLLDKGEMLVITDVTKEAKRGDVAVFHLGVSNIQSEEYVYAIEVSFDGSTGDATACSNAVNACSWLLLPKKEVSIATSQREYFPIGVEVPDSIQKGQYAFNIDVCYGSTPGVKCIRDSSGVINRFGTRQRVYVSVI